MTNAVQHVLPEGIIKVCSNDPAADCILISSCFLSSHALPVIGSVRLQSCDSYSSKTHFVNTECIRFTAAEYYLGGELMMPVITGS